MSVDVDPEGQRLPIKLDATSNGEFAPIPLDKSLHRANALAAEWAGENARKLGTSRRDFLVSSCGAASTLLAFNAAHAAAGRTGGYFDLAHEAALDRQVAAHQLGKKEFIFDVQGHFVSPTGAWLKNVGPKERPFAEFPKAAGAAHANPNSRAYLNLLGPRAFIKDVFMDSDTDIMVLSFVPSTRDAPPVTMEEAVATRAIVDRMQGSKRLLIHGRVAPNQPGDIEDMERLKGYGISAYKTYTQWGPNRGPGYWLTDDIGIAFIENARKLGVRNICVHKGIPFGKHSYEHSTARDIGPIARRFPDMNFLVYHSGHVIGQKEGVYNPGRTDGIDALITSLLKAGIKPNSNVYAELGSTWRYLALRDPSSAAHALGKLFKYVGEDNVLWGTDSIWYGSPQDQIHAFRSFQIAEAWQASYGYPKITPQLRAKVFGLNASKVYGLKAEELQRYTQGDAVAREKLAYAEAPNPSFATYGPRTRQEFLNFRRASPLP